MPDSFQPQTHAVLKLIFTSLRPITNLFQLKNVANVLAAAECYCARLDYGSALTVLLEAFIHNAAKDLPGLEAHCATVNLSAKPEPQLKEGEPPLDFSKSLDQLLAWMRTWFTPPASD